MATRPYTGPRVIGTGLPQSGTSSLKAALRILGFKTCHWSKDVLDETFPYTTSRSWTRACNTESKEERQALLRQIFEKGRFTAAVELPSALFVADLVEIFPDAKFIHTTSRSPILWRRHFNGALGQVFRPLNALACLLLPAWTLSIRPLLSAMHARAERELGARLFAAITDVTILHRHTDYVRQVVPKERLLVFDAREHGWEELCEFLGVDFPTGPNGRELNYRPFVDEGKAVRRVMERTVVLGWMAWGVGVVGIFMAMKRWGGWLRRLASRDVFVNRWLYDIGALERR